MDSQRSNVEELFLEVVQKDPAERLAFWEATRFDSKVRTRVEALLKAHDSAGTFLEGPAVQPAPFASKQYLRAHDRDNSPPWPAQETLDFLDRCDTPDRLGLLAHYEVLDFVGRGGMGVVLRALDVKLKRVVAVKVLTPQLAANAIARQRFLREAQAAAAVSHDHIVAIHAVDEFNGLPYLVMEYVSGLSLQQKIDGAGALPLAQILGIGMQIASGLAGAHAQGLVHRDIKPANILLENGSERVKITDFGLARSIDDVRITQAGVVYGTPLYMSPEQAQGERVDQRSDMFSLGSVMYAMSTGRPPFPGDTSLAVLRRVCDDTPRPIQEIIPEMPEWLIAIIAKLHAKKPADRFASVLEVADLLGRCLSELQRQGRVESLGDTQPLVPKPTSAVPEPVEGKRPKSEKRPSHRRRWVAAAAMLVLFAGFGLTEVTGITDVRATVIRLFSLDEPPGLSAINKLKSAPKTRPALPNGSKKYAAGATDRPVRVFVLAGDSNMAGRATVALLKYQANQAETKELFQHLIQDGKWVVREDVWIKNFKQKGNLTVGFGQSPDRFGPELEFGQVVGDYFDEQVLLIKTCWGGYSMHRDFRSPSSSLPPQEVLEQLRKELQKFKANATLADVERSYGATYREMLKEVRETLASLGEHFPSYQGQGFEIAGFVWFQGWNDMVDPNHSLAYAEYLANFIRDLRVDLKAPNLPFVIGQMGVDPDSVLPGTNESNFRAAQAEVASLPEFKGNVKLVATDPFWDHEAHAVYRKGWQNYKDEWDKVGSDARYHYLGSAKTICRIGKAFGEAIIELRRAGARY